MPPSATRTPPQLDARRTGNGRDVGSVTSAPAMPPTSGTDTVLNRCAAPAAARPPSHALRWLDRLPSADRLTIAVILIVVALVSVPLVRRVALRQNERDALRALVILARAQERVGAHDLASLIAAAPEVTASLPDAKLLDGGRLLRHGYLIALEPTAEGPAFVAWPSRYGHSGLGAFRLAPDGRLYGLPNRDGRASGRARPAAGEGWRPLRVSP